MNPPQLRIRSLIVVVALIGVALGIHSYITRLPKTHTVRPGENFWTISRKYYGKGRFYNALWEANRNQVPRMEELPVGQVIEIPPPARLSLQQPED